METFETNHQHCTGSPQSSHATHSSTLLPSPSLELPTTSETPVLDPRPVLCWQSSAADCSNTTTVSSRPPPQAADDVIMTPFHHNLGSTPDNSTSSGLDDVATFDQLPLDLVSELLDVWFTKYHAWCPILHQSSLLEALRNLNDTDTSSWKLVIKAIAATTVHHCSLHPAVLTQRGKLTQTLKQSVLLEAIGERSIRAMQALLIISILDYGSDRLSELWSLMSVCKRISMQLDLPAIVNSQNVEVGSDSSNLHHSTSNNAAAIHREECIRAYWMIELFDRVSTLGLKWDPGSATVTATSILPCSDYAWGNPGLIFNVGSMGPIQYSSAFTLYLTLVLTELPILQDFLRRPSNLNTTERILAWQSKAQTIDERLTSWREEFVAAVFRLINAKHAPEISEMEPNIVLTNCLLNM
jgi:hypothetical protein